MTERTPNQGGVPLPSALQNETPNPVDVNAKPDVAAVEEPAPQVAPTVEQVARTARPAEAPIPTINGQPPQPQVAYPNQPTQQQPMPSPAMRQTAAPAPSNPLMQYFRHSATTIQLPTRGRWWTPGSIELDHTGMLQVYPMTAKDEIMMKSPDGLLSGTSVVEVIQSCIPAIKDAWQMCALDLDTILIGIRIASYGHSMELGTTCPHCGAENDTEVNLITVLDSIPEARFQEEVVINGLRIQLQPYNYKFITDTNINTFEEQRLLSTLRDDDMSTEERTTFFKNTFHKLAKHTIESISKAVVQVTLPDGTIVNDTGMIEQYFDNCDRETFKKVREAISNIPKSVKAPPIIVKCESCGKEYSSDLEFDHSNFFE